MSISQFFILSARGDTLITKDFRRELQKGTNELFFRKVTIDSENEDIAPIFNINGINYIHIKTNNLYFILTTVDNVSPLLYYETLTRTMNIIKDFIGELSEEAIRKNFTLIYEILDEEIDYGIPQLTSSEIIKPFIFTQPVVMMHKNLNENIKEVFRRDTKSQDSTKRSLNKEGKNEIYVDILEKVTCLFNSNGRIVNSAVDGCIKMKSYLKGCPELKLELNDEIYIGKSNYDTGRIAIEDCNFYKSVNTNDFERTRRMYFIPPEGEFILMNYRVNGEFTPPFKVYGIINEADYKLSVNLKLQANFSDKYFGNAIVLKFNVPKNTQNVYMDLPKQNKINQKVDYKQNEHLCIWNIQKIQGGAEATMECKITLQTNTPRQSRKEVGPVILIFDITNFNISKMQIKELQVTANNYNYRALRWVRMITQSNSYVIRIA